MSHDSHLLSHTTNTIHQHHPPILQVKTDKATNDKLKREQIEAESVARKNSDEIERLKKLLAEAMTAKAAVDAAMVLLTTGRYMGPCCSPCSPDHPLYCTPYRTPSHTNFTTTCHTNCHTFCLTPT